MSEPRVPSILGWLSDAFQRLSERAQSSLGPLAPAPSLSSGSLLPAFPVLHSPLSPCGWTRRICRFVSQMLVGDASEYLPRHFPSSFLAFDGPSTAAPTFSSPFPRRVYPTKPAAPSSSSLDLLSRARATVLSMAEEGTTLAHLEDLTWGVALPLRQVLAACRENPELSWSRECFMLVGREDLAVLAPFYHSASTQETAGASFSASPSSSASSALTQSQELFFAPSAALVATAGSPHGTPLPPVLPIPPIVPASSLPGLPPNASGQQQRHAATAASTAAAAAAGRPATAGPQDALHVGGPGATTGPTTSGAATSAWEGVELENPVCELRFPVDRRVREVQRVLSCGRVLPVHLPPAVISGLSDHEVVAEQQARLLTLARRALGSCVGRGMLTLWTAPQPLVDAIPIPPIVLTGRVAATKTTITLDTALLQNHNLMVNPGNTMGSGSAAQDPLAWPEFHNGVAAGLRTSAPHTARGVDMCVTDVMTGIAGAAAAAGMSGSSRQSARTLGEAHAHARAHVRKHVGAMEGGSSAAGRAHMISTWIAYNKPTLSELTNAHAGVLLALGLQGYLSSLTMTKVFEYLSVGHTLTSVGLLLGISASKRGTMDENVAKLLSVHVPALHPPSSADLDVPQVLQTSAVMGLGLLYQGTSHRHMTETLLREIYPQGYGSHAATSSTSPAAPLPFSLASILAPFSSSSAGGAHTGSAAAGTNGASANNGTSTPGGQVNREAHALTAGLALGMVTLGQGGQAPGLADLKLGDRLCAYVHGGMTKLCLRVVYSLILVSLQRVCKAARASPVLLRVQRWPSCTSTQTTSALRRGWRCPAHCTCWTQCALSCC